jgi:hypothetical protein
VGSPHPAGERRPRGSSWHTGFGPFVHGRRIGTRDGRRSLGHQANRGRTSGVGGRARIRLPFTTPSLRWISARAGGWSTSIRGRSRAAGCGHEQDGGRSRANSGATCDGRFSRMVQRRHGGRCWNWSGGSPHRYPAARPCRYRHRFGRGRALDRVSCQDFLTPTCNGASARRELGRAARNGSRRGCVYLPVSGRSDGRLVRASRRCLWGRPSGGSARLLRFHRVLGGWSVCRRPTDESNPRRVHRAVGRNPGRGWSRVRTHGGALPSG